MSKKRLSADAVLHGTEQAPQEGSIKYVSEFTNKTICLKKMVKDANGKRVPLYTIDGDGNKKHNPELVTYHFVPVFQGKDKRTGVRSLHTPKSFFIADPKNFEDQDDFKDVIAALEKMCKDPIERVYSEDDFFKLRNPEAFKIAKEKSDLEDEVERLKAQNEELNKRLGFNNKR